MKKMFFFVILLAVLCNETFAKELSLDSAIKALAEEITNSKKLGQWKRIVLTDFSDSIEIQNYIEEELTNKLINNFTIIDRKNLGILREELEFQNTGKVDPKDRLNIGSVLKADFVLWGSFKDGKLTIEVQKLDGASFVVSRDVDKNDFVLKNLEKNTLNRDCLIITCPRLPKRKDAVEIAVDSLSKKIRESTINKILVYNIFADRTNISDEIYTKIREKLSKKENVILISSRNNMGKIEAEKNFQASEVKFVGAHAIIYGNIRPIGKDYRLFLYAVNVETAKIIATHSQLIEGDEKIKDIDLPSKINKVDVEPLSSDKIIVSWEKIPNARSFIVYRTNSEDAGVQQIRTEANRITDIGLKHESKYCYSVQSRNTAGTSEKSEEKCETTYGAPRFDNEPEFKDKTENSVVVMWNKISGASEYNIKRCLGNQCNYPDLIANKLRDTIYKDTGLKNATSYKYFIEAKNTAGTSTSKGITVITKPKPPKIVAAEPRANRITLKWEDEQENISHYIVEREGYSEKSNNKEKEITGLKPNTSYQFRLKSVNLQNDESEFSEPFSIKTSGKPNAPDFMNIQIEPPTYSSYRTITINWGSVPKADKYFIYRNEDILDSTTEFSYRDNLRLEKGTKYTYKISAKNAAGESEKISRFIFAEPSEPKNITKTTIDTNLFLIKWESVQYASQYLIEYDINNSRNKKIDSTQGTSFRIKLPYSSILTFCISAQNETGKSDCSEKEIKTLDIPQKMDDLELKVLSANSIALGWSKVQDASEYRLYLCELNLFGKQSCDSLIYSGTNTSYIHKGLEANTKYKYAISAKNAAGESAKIEGEEKTYILPPVIVDIENIGSDSAKITWQKSDGAEYYKIYRNDSDRDIGYTESNEWVDNVEAKKEYSYHVSAVSRNREFPSETKKHKTLAKGTLVLINDNPSGNVISGYKIKSGSKIIEKSLYLTKNNEEPIQLPVDGTNCELYIITRESGEIKGDKKFKIEDGKEIIFKYKRTELLKTTR